MADQGTDQLRSGASHEAPRPMRPSEIISRRSVQQHSVDTSPQTKRRRNDAFPSTLRTWIGARLDAGPSGRSAAITHVMEVYATPLKVYYLGSSFRWMGDADDLVQGFFADRLSREVFLNRWRDSKRPLRYWLIVAFKHYMFEERRRRQRAQTLAIPDNEGNDSNEEPDGAYDRQCALSLVHQALSQAQHACDSDGLSEHWLTFIRHSMHGEPYAAIAATLGTDPVRAAVMARTACNRFKRTLREFIGWEGAQPDQVDLEIHQLMEALRQ